MVIAIDARSIEGPKTGVGVYLTNLLKFWKEEKKHKFILYFKDRIPESDLIENGNFENKLLKNPFGFSSNFFFQHFLLPYNLAKDKVDFFFSPFYLKPFYCPVKSSITLHDISYEAHPEWFDFKSQFILRTLSRRSAKTADLIFTVSNYSKDEIIKYYRVSTEKVSVTHLASDKNLEETKNFGRKNELKIRGKYGLRGKFILCVGSIFTRRHMPEIIRAFEKTIKEHSDYQLAIIGKNHTYPFIDINGQIENTNKSAGKNIIARFDFASSDEELLILYNLCEFVVYLSDYEGFGLPIVEAQSLAKPVVTSYNSSLIEVGDSSVEFVKNNTVDEIYGSLERLISDENYRKELIKLGGENVKRFSWEKCAKETLGGILNIECRM